MKPWLKLGSTAATLAFLAACSSGIQTPEAEPALETQADGSEYRRILASSDDAEEALSGNVYLSSPDLNMGLSTLNEPTAIGLRFADLAIPQGATITNATVSFIPAETRSTAATLTFRGQGSADTGTFSATTDNVTARPDTAASVSWSVPAWTASTTFPTDGTAQSPNLKAIVQEVVNKSEWVSGNAINLFVTGSGKRLAHSFESTGKSPALYVVFTTDTNLPPVPPEVAVWQSRLETALNQPDKVHYDPKQIAATGDLYKYARDLNDALTSFTAAYRINRDPATVRYMVDVLNIMKSKLRDTNNDGNRNWIYLSGKDSVSECRAALANQNDTSPDLCGDDRHNMDEMMTHAGLAGVVYTLQQAGYTTDASFWKDYLRNDFEAKWRTRSGMSSGYPFVDHKLMHPTAQFARYHFYMYKLTGNSSYYSEAQRLVGLVKGTMRTSGDGYVWSHFRSTTSDCQPTVYLGYTMGAMADLAVVDSSLYSSSFMAKIANTVANRLIRTSDGHSMVGNICTNEGVYGDYWGFSKHLYAVSAPWDASGKIERTLRETFKATNQGYYIVPSMMIHSLGR